MQIFKILIIIWFFVINSFVVHAACNISELEKRLETYTSIVKEATNKLKVKMASVGCTESSKSQINCDQEAQRKIYVDYLTDYNNTMAGIISMENQEYGCPKELVDSLMKKKE